MKETIEQIFNKIVDIINKTNPHKEIILFGYDIEYEDLYESSSREASIAREELLETKHDIYLNALDEYNSGLEEEDKIKYWDCSDDIIDLSENLYNYVNESFEVIIEPTSKIKTIRKK